MLTSPNLGTGSCDPQPHVGLWSQFSCRRAEIQNGIKGRLYHMLNLLYAKSNHLYVGAERRTQVYVLCHPSLSMPSRRAPGVARFRMIYILSASQLSPAYRPDAAETQRFLSGRCIERDKARWLLCRLSHHMSLLVPAPFRGMRSAIPRYAVRSFFTGVGQMLMYKRMGGRDDVSSPLRGHQTRPALILVFTHGCAVPFILQPSTSSITTSS
jgi:hypothetical protein